MGVGMKNAGGHELTGKRTQADHGHFLRIDAVTPDLVHPVHFDPLDEFHHQHRFFRIIPIHFGDVNLIDILETAGEALDVPRLR
jgi:hypothetical protein